jgi:hypothetical protein
MYTPLTPAVAAVLLMAMALALTLKAREGGLTGRVEQREKRSERMKRRLLVKTIVQIFLCCWSVDEFSYRVVVEAVNLY